MHQPQPGSSESTPHRSPRPRASKRQLAKELRRFKAMRALEQTFAYLHATGAIEAHCLVAEAVTEECGDPWYNLATRDTDLADEVQYLQSRNLLLIHPEHPHWVRLCDEAEPVSQVVN